MRTFKWLMGLCAVLSSAVLAAEPAKYTETIPGTTVMFEMVKVPGGTLKGFKLNKDADAKDVLIKSFYMGTTEVKNEEYGFWSYARDIADPTERAATYGKSRPSVPYESPTFNFGDEGYPALTMTRFSATKYCEWLSEKTKKKYRLPTPEEWEWAARGGVEGNITAEQIKEMAWYVDNSPTDEFLGGKTHPVGKLKPNAYGLYDMFGNVCEWVLSPGEDPLAKPTYTAGGSWKSKLESLSPSYRQAMQSSWQQRDPNDPKSRLWLSDGSFVGFRIVRDGE
jgi:formylglycine-generating enzyme required for sulfatase activity